jgi:disulfide bond formation protein DsbB
MTRRRAPYHYSLFALALSAGLLIGAWVFEYGFGYAPCQMCYWQRHAHKAVIVIAALSAFWQFSRGEDLRPAAMLIIAAFLLSAGLALWHVGVEQGLIEALPSCTGGAVDLSAIGEGDLLGSLDKKIKPPACSEVAWALFGISMAGYNALLSVLGAALGVIALRRSQV